MNYGKKSTAKKRTALISRSSMMGKRATDSTLHRSNLSGCGVIQGCN